MGLTNFTERAWLPGQFTTGHGRRPRLYQSTYSYIIRASSSATAGHKSVLTTYCLQLTAMNGRRFERQANVFSDTSTGSHAHAHIKTS